MLDVGDLAPDFSLPGTLGEEVTLGAFQNRKYVLLIFYPLAFTPV